MKFPTWTLLSLLSFSSSSSVSALFADEAGVNDFVVATCGHSKNKYIHVDSMNNALVTSDAHNDDKDNDNASSTSCFVASRSIATGQVNWRRNVCATVNNKDNSHSVSTSSKYVCTVDHNGMVRAWTTKEGALVWEYPMEVTATKSKQRKSDAASINAPQIWTSEQITAVSYGHDDSVLLLDTTTGKPLGANNIIKASSVLGHAKIKGSNGEATLLKLLSMNNKNYALVGYSTKDDKTMVDGNSLALVELVYNSSSSNGDDDPSISFGQVTKPQEGKGKFFNKNQLEIIRKGPKVFAIANADIQFELGTNGDDNKNDSSSSFLAFPSKTKTPMYYDTTQQEWNTMLDGTESSKHENMVYCSAMNLALALEPSTKSSNTNKNDYFVWAYELDTTSNNNNKLNHISLQGDTIIPLTPQDTIESMVLVGCTSDTTSLLITTPTGTTHQLVFTKESAVTTSKLSWTAEEGLASISSAILLDASHGTSPTSIVDALTQEEETAALQRLSFTSRLQNQISDMTNMYFNLFSGIGGGSSTGNGGDVDANVHDRNHIFGFVKVAVLLSQANHKLYGMETSSSTRGHVKWTLSLPSNAIWHTMVHGTASGVTAVDHHHAMGSHSREVLLVSALPSDTNDGSNVVQWTCLDGTTGKVHSTDTITTKGGVVQVIPLFATSPSTSSSCRQMAILLEQEKTVTLIPQDLKHQAVHELSNGEIVNGLYAHTIHKDESILESLQLLQEPTNDNTIMSARLVGQTTFHGERIVRVAYPPRDEVVQSPCAVTGDDSLLLKYLNPHMAVIVTMLDSTTTTDGEADTEEDDFATILNAAQPSTTKKSFKNSKTSSSSSSTVANTKSDTAATPEVPKDAPNLFVNVVDTVSGRVLYRASHANAEVSTKNVPVVINENWIIYSFFNDKTRRTELGVLSLYEGMIPKTGITAFQSAEQSVQFSSLDARDSKPVVMAKTYGIAKPITAMGVTSTRGGISARHMILATGDDKIMSFDRRMVEPRRPVGDLRDAEKQEGLKQYNPLIPLVSLMTPSHNQTVHSVQTIVSASTALESQSLVLAFGGPDIFFVRMSPSKGFDLLPDSFNRILLSVVVLGLLIVLFVVKGMSSKKAVTMSWS